MKKVSIEFEQQALAQLANTPIEVQDEISCWINLLSDLGIDKAREFKIKYDGPLNIEIDEINNIRKIQLKDSWHAIYTLEQDSVTIKNLVDIA
ncbi:hypothetical protein [Halobacteriovorax sp. DA5]|uniref:hypothetical protein n=1 Tax=unclassified Halobacteriovorax TaxID=2639665 RepID=UPI000CD220DC|nr:hypothetical protein [Halobacteriovorax sp. DA5]POB12689.1 hypothetical protein C0Z22_14480 [Halobacteriovorax sp. DA5]